MKNVPNATGTRWDMLWKKQYEILVKFRSKNPDRWPKAIEEFPKGNRLGQWVLRQRDLKERGEIEADRESLLSKIGFHWDKVDEREAHWDEQFQYLKDFRKKFPKRWPFAREEFPKGNRLGLWVWRQRQNAARKLLEKDRKVQLEKIGFPLSLPDPWETHYQTLKEYRAKFSDRWPKAREEFPKGNRLGLWCHLQRCAQKAGTLDSERTKKLDKIRFQWSVKDVSWNRYFEMLKAYKKKNLQTWPVLAASALEDRRLIAWCSTQRNKSRQGKLGPEFKAQLDKLGFRW
jgi:Helicase associated domain